MNEWLAVRRTSHLLPAKTWCSVGYFSDSGCTGRPAGTAGDPRPASSGRPGVQLFVFDGPRTRKKNNNNKKKITEKEEMIHAKGLKTQTCPE